MNNPELQIAVIGTGAVGGYYGALLQKSGLDLHFLLHRDYEHVRTNGLFIESPTGNIHLPAVKAYNDPQKMPRCDVVIVALKTTANALLPEILPYVLKEGGVVITLQNGLGSEAEIASIVGPDHVLGGLCFLCANKVGPGHVRHLDYGLITLGEYRGDEQPAGLTRRLNDIGNYFSQAGISIQLIQDLALARWKKLVWNIPFNGLAVVKDSMTDALVKDPETRILCEKLMNEVAQASAACARPIDPAFIQKMLNDTEKMTPYAPSMKLDYDRENPMEIESIYKNPIQEAKNKGVSMPETEMLYQQLRAINAFPS
jgi:2-dehydropantoate 2-reductase